LTLNVLDEWGRVVNEDNPLIIEHNGTTGGTVTLQLTLVNSSVDHYYKNVSLEVNNALPITAGLLIHGEVVPHHTFIKNITRLQPKEEVRFYLQTHIPVNTSERVVDSMLLGISGMCYPVPY